jgi:hypothetical protein
MFVVIMLYNYVIIGMGESMFVLGDSIVYGVGVEMLEEIIVGYLF